VKRLIEAVVRFEIAESFGADGFLGGERAAGDEADHEKRRGDDDEKDGDRLEQAAEDEAQHCGESNEGRRRDDKCGMAGGEGLTTETQRHREEGGELRGRAATYG
jgi:hypothetical protein